MQKALQFTIRESFPVLVPRFVEVIRQEALENAKEKKNMLLVDELVSILWCAMKLNFV